MRIILIVGMLCVNLGTYASNAAALKYTVNNHPHHNHSQKNSPRKVVYPRQLHNKNVLRVIAAWKLNAQNPDLLRTVDRAEINQEMEILIEKEKRIKEEEVRKAAFEAEFVNRELAKLKVVCMNTDRERQPD